MKYKVKIHKRVQKYLSKLNLKQKSNILSKLKQLENGDWETLDIKNMQGEWEGYKRFRIGDLRVIFLMIEDTIYVDYIGARGDIYK